MSEGKLVSIGLPVYNGENYLRLALESLLAQEYEHFELIISDNGSKDGTEAICREFAARDARIRYVRHAENRGSPWNFKYVVEQARGEYFLWAAHDDVWSPPFLRKCVEMMERHPSAVLCCTEINFIDGAGQRSAHYANYKNIETPGKSAAGRVHELISRMGWFAIYGLMRTEATRKIALGISDYGCDVIQLLELLLQGDFVKVPERLFHFRILIEGKTPEDYQNDFQSGSRATRMPYAGLAARLMRTVYESELTAKEKAEVFADCILTLTCSNPAWRESIASEVLGAGAGARLNDSQFALLLGMVLNLSVPLDEIRDNPVSAAIYRGALNLPDVLGACRKVLGGGGGEIAAAAAASAADATAQVDLFRRAAELVKQGRLEEASKAFDVALQHGETSDGWSDWATVQLARNKMEAAERGLRRAMELDKGNTQAAAKLGIVLAGRGDISEAVGLLEQGIGGVEGERRAAIEELLKGCREKLGAVAKIAG